MMDALDSFFSMITLRWKPITIRESKTLTQVIGIELMASGRPETALLDPGTSTFDDQNLDFR